MKHGGAFSSFAPFPLQIDGVRLGRGGGAAAKRGNTALTVMRFTET